jgi:hypothetical protein
VIWGGLVLVSLLVYTVIGISLADRVSRIVKRLENVTQAAEKLTEAARLLDRNK